PVTLRRRRRVLVLAAASHCEDQRDGAGPRDPSPHGKPPDDRPSSVGSTGRPAIRMSAVALPEARDALAEPEQTEAGERPGERRSRGSTERDATPDRSEQRDRCHDQEQLSQLDAEVEGDEAGGEGGAGEAQFQERAGEAETVHQPEAEGEAPAPAN